MKIYKQNRWFTLDEYTVCVGELKDGMFLDGGKEVRAARIHAAYENKSNRLLKYVTLQWLLFDTEGYSYESAILRKLYGTDEQRKLREGHLNPGKSTRGWIAFQLPKDAEISHVQFRANYMAKAVADVALVLDDSGKNRGITAVSPSSSIPPALFNAGQLYELKKPIIDFHGNEFLPQDRLTFVKSYDPHHGLYTFVFAEATLYLHEGKHAEILENNGRYFTPIGHHKQRKPLMQKLKLGKRT